MKLGKLLRGIASYLSRRNVDPAEAIARAAGKGKVADALDTAQDVVDVVKGRGI